MENIYEPNEFEQESADGRQSQEGDTPVPEEPTPNPDATRETEPYHGAGTGRKESPFADSPYYAASEQPVNDQPQANAGNQNQQQAWQQPVYQATVENTNPPKSRKVKKEKSGKKVWRTVLAAALTLVVIAGSCGITASVVNTHWEKETSEMEQTLNQKIADLQNRINTSSAGDGTSVSGSPVASTEGGLTPGQVYAQNVNSVVAISNKATTNIYGQVTETASSGSGFILSEDGYIVSNYHVIENANTLTVMTYTGDEYTASVVGYDSSNDVALLKVDATGLQAAKLGSSDALIVGDQVVAIGNPLGELTSSLSVGYVSAKDRTINTDGTYINMIQIDAAINPGNSGGPLFNMKGEVVGITTAKYSGETSSGASIEGIGFAIPIDDVAGIVSDLEQYGYVTGAYLGVTVRSVDSTTSQTYGLPLGSLVDSVVEGGSADRAGVQKQDIITALGSYTVESNTDLTRALRKFKAGDTTTITVYRSGKTLDLTITLDEKPKPEENTTTEGSGEMPSDGNYEDWYNYFAPFFGNGRG